jgi:hypothetical protein
MSGGTDRHMSEALPESVRSVDFRQENPAEFLEGYHTVMGQKITTEKNQTNFSEYDKISDILAIS